ncbi:MAG: PfkB family carbohydrate kinase [Desulfobacteraceae bacterium]
MILVIGEILFDVFPDYKRIGGAPFNFAFHLKKLGCSVRFVSKVGNDIYGREIHKFLARHDFDLNDIQVDNQAGTGEVRVFFEKDGRHRFEILENKAYDLISYSPRLKKQVEGKLDAVYFGTLVQRTKPGAALIARVMAEKRKQAKAFCDLNLRPDCYTRETVHASLQYADILKLSREELVTVVFGSPHAGAEDVISTLMEKHRLETVILTKGAGGSEWMDKKGHYKIKPSGDIPVKDTVGAGDAFAAMTAACLMKNIGPEKAMALSQSFASDICTIKGAIPDDGDFYDKYIDQLEGR